MSKPTLWERFTANPERMSTIMALVFLIALFPIFYPVPFPMAYGFLTTDYFNLMEGGPMSYGGTEPGIQAGNIFIWGETSDHAADYNAYRDFYTMFVRQALEHHAKIILAQFGLGSLSMFKDMLSRYLQPYNLVEGTDYVITQFIPGMESGMALFASDIHAFTDIHGVSLADPSLLTAPYASFDDINPLYIYGTVCRTTDWDMFIRQWCKYSNAKFIQQASYELAAAHYGTLVKACPYYNFEAESIVASKWGSKYLGEEVAKVQSQDVWCIMYLPLVFWALIVNWRKVIAGKEKVELFRTRVGEKGV